jgi:hypothetical protein
MMGGYHDIHNASVLHGHMASVRFRRAGATQKTSVCLIIKIAFVLPVGLCGISLLEKVRVVIMCAC